MVAADATYAIAAGRAVAEALMLDTCEIRRPSIPDTNPDTGVVTPDGAAVYTGKAKVQSLAPQEDNPEAGGATLTVQRYRLDIPVGSYAPRIGDVATILTAVADPHLVGRKFRVVALLHKTLATAYRLGVENR